MKTARPRNFPLRPSFSALLIGAALLGITATVMLKYSNQAQAANGVPRPDHVVIVIEENHDLVQIMGNPCCPYINAQGNAGALMTNSHAITHPSQPNYLQLFSGSNQGVTDDSCPHTFSAVNLGQELIAAGLTFTGYSEDLLAAGSTVCTSGSYARKHSPWVNFSNVPATTNLPLTRFPTDFTQLPTVSIVIPNLCNDMHDCSPSTGDTWLRTHLDGYIQWAQTHNSLFILTFDENDSSPGNRIETIFEGPMVRPGQYTENITHYNMLRTLEDMYNLPYAGQSATAAPITDIWTTSPTPTPTATGSVTTVFQDGVLPSPSYAGTRDTVIKQANATTNFGPATTLDMDGDDGNGVDKSILLKWDTASIPSGKSVTAVTLALRVVNSTANTYQIFEAKRNWVETQATWNVFATGSSWQVAGAAGANDRGATVLATVGPASSGTTVTVSLNASGVALVQNWINNPSANFGFLMTNSTNTDGLDFSSSEAATASTRPKLTITYH